MISSGPDRGRDLIGGVAHAFGSNLKKVEAEIAANVDGFALLAKQPDRAKGTPSRQLSCCRSKPARQDRWFDALGWRPIASETKMLLSVPAEATFESATATYERWADMAVAGVAYHF